MTTIIYDPFRSESTTALFTGGPRFIQEVLIPHLRSSPGFRSSGIRTSEEQDITYQLKNAENSWSQLLMGTWSLFQRSPRVMVSVADDPRSLVPCLVNMLLKKHTRLLLPIPHLIRPPSHRPGPRLRNIIAYLWQQLALRICVRFGVEFVVMNEVTRAQLSHLINRVAYQKNSQRSTVLLLQPKPPIPSSDSQAPRLRQFSVIGRLAEHKGSLDIPLLVKELQSVSRHPWKCFVVGEFRSQTAHRLLSAAKYFGVESLITLTGGVSDASRDEIMTSSALLVLLSHEEGYSYVIHDAISAGKVVVCWNLPELITTWCDYDNVHFFSLGDTKHMAQFMESYIH